MCLLQPPGYPKRDEWEPLPHWVDIQAYQRLFSPHRSNCRFCRARANIWLWLLLNFLINFFIIFIVYRDAQTPPGVVPTTEISPPGVVRKSPMSSAHRAAVRQLKPMKQRVGYLQQQVRSEVQFILIISSIDISDLLFMSVSSTQYCSLWNRVAYLQQQVRSEI